VTPVSHEPADRRAFALIDRHLAEFAAHAAAALGPGTACSITMRTDGTDRRSASSDAASAACDDVEIRTGTGPCLDALDTGRPVLVDDVTAGTPWPQWASAAQGAGFRSSGALPAHPRSAARMTMNVYHRRPGPWDRDVLVRADAYAQEIGRVVDLCLDLRDLDAQRVALQDALTAQADIDRAVGAVMVTNQCDARAALDILKSGAASRTVGLVDVARAVLDNLVPRDPGADA
jgi:hypothetical protein